MFKLTLSFCLSRCLSVSHSPSAYFSLSVHVSVVSLSLCLSVCVYLSLAQRRLRAHSGQRASGAAATHELYANENHTSLPLSSTRTPALPWTASCTHPSAHNARLAVPRQGKRAL